MAFLFVIALLALSSWSVFSTFQRLRCAQAVKVWWIAFVGLTVVGLVAGCWLVFSSEYQVSARTRYVSFPMPSAAVHWGM